MEFLQHRQSKEVYQFAYSTPTTVMKLTVTVYFEMENGRVRHHYAVWNMETTLYEIINNEQDETGLFTLNGRTDASANDTSTYLLLERIKCVAASMVANYGSQTTNALQQIM